MKKQPAHGCMTAARIICRTWEHTNRALIFQSVPECPGVSRSVPSVPLSQPLGGGTVGQRDNSRKPIIKKSHEQLFITEI